MTLASLVTFLLTSGTSPQSLRHTLEAGKLHLRLGDNSVLNFVGKRSPGTLHGSDEERSVGSVMNSLDIIAHSLGRFALCGLEDRFDLN